VLQVVSRGAYNNNAHPKYGRHQKQEKDSVDFDFDDGGEKHVSHVQSHREIDHDHAADRQVNTHS